MGSNTHIQAIAARYFAIWSVHQTLRNQFREKIVVEQARVKLEPWRNARANDASNAFDRKDRLKRSGFDREDFQARNSANLSSAFIRQRAHMKELQGFQRR